MGLLRQTILNNYERCPYMCAQEFGTLLEPVDRVDNEEHTNKYASCGIAAHEAMEHWGVNKMTGLDVSLIGVHDKLDERFALIPPSLFKDKSDSDEFFNSLHEQINWLYEKSYLITPVAVEKEFTFDSLYEDIDCGFTGTIDRIDGSIYEQDVDIIDYKTGATYTKKELSCNMQAGIYAEAFKKIYDFYPKRFVFLFSKHKKTKIIYINPEFLAQSKARIKGLYMKMQQGDYNPTPGNKYFCKNFCKVYKLCPYFKRSGGWGNVDYQVFRPEDNVI